jgi:hypothetical protein
MLAVTIALSVAVAATHEPTGSPREPPGVRLWSSEDAIVDALHADPDLRARVLLSLSYRLEDDERDLATLSATHARRHLGADSDAASSGSASGSASGSGSGSGSGCGKTPPIPHSFFALTCKPGQDPLTDHCVYWDWSWTGAWIIILVLLTVIVEQCFHQSEHYIEEQAPRHNKKLLLVLWNKVTARN